MVAIRENGATSGAGVLAAFGSTVYSLAEVSYDALGRPECSEQRVNSAVFETISYTAEDGLGASAPAWSESACSAKSAGTQRRRRRREAGGATARMRRPAEA
jgi:hypothetical protein